MIWWKVAYWLSISVEVELLCHVIALAGPLISLLEDDVVARPEGSALLGNVHEGRTEIVGSVSQPKRERFLGAGNNLPCTPILNGIAGNDSMVVKTVVEPVQTEAAIITDNRPSFSFGQMMNQKTPAFPPEYDPDQIPPLQDPCFDDMPDRIGFER